MTFEGITRKIDKEISRRRGEGKRIWFDIDMEINGFSNQLKKYYKDLGYSIEIRQCRGCLYRKADIIISW